MGSKAKAKAVPDAWDEDWETIADREEQAQPAEDQKKVSSKVSKAQRRAQHAEFNRQLWAEAESSQTFHFLESRATSVPLKSDYKQPVTVLSRKPQIACKSPSSPAGGAAAASPSLDASLARLDVNGNPGYNDEKDDEADSDGDADKKGPQQQMTPEERQANTLRQREEKQRKYEEVRERLFGSSSATPSGASSPGSTTPPPQSASSSSQHQNQKENRWRGRNRQNGRVDSSSRENTTEKREAPTSSSGRTKQLYDPDYSPKPNSSYGQKRDKPSQRRTNTNNNDDDVDGNIQQQPQAPVRNPRGPDGSGRGGFGFNQDGPGRGR